MARPSRGLSESQLVVRLPAEVRARIERVRELLAKRAGSRAVTETPLSSVVRDALILGLDAIESGATGPARPRGGKATARRG